MTGKGAGGRSAVPLAHGLRVFLVGGLEEEPGGFAAGAQHRGGDSGARSPPRVIMGDHYDTAYMEDCYGKDGARLAAAGADDNHSPRSLLCSAPKFFLELSKAGKLGCDIWLVHLTGEEFPSDCLAPAICVSGWWNLAEAASAERTGARSITHALPGGIRARYGRAQQRPRARTSSRSRRARVAPLCGGVPGAPATRAWNAAAPAWNAKPSRRGCPRCRRSADPAIVPDVGRIPFCPERCACLQPPQHPVPTPTAKSSPTPASRSCSSWRTYDINRVGYHDTHDTMENIDLGLRGGGERDRD